MCYAYFSFSFAGSLFFPCMSCVVVMLLVCVLRPFGPSHQFFFESSLISIKLELGFGGIIFFFALFSLFLFFLNGDNHWPIGHASTVLRDAPPGQEVGLIVARRTGRLRRQVAATAIKTDKAWRVFFKKKHLAFFFLFSSLFLFYFDHIDYTAVKGTQVVFFLVS